MNKAYEVADRLMEWVSSLLHRITGESSPVWDRIVYGILVFVIAIVVARILRMIVIYVIHRIIKYKGGDLLKGLVEAKVFTHITHVIPPLVILSLLPFAFHGTPELLRIIEKVCWIYLLGVLVFSINTQISVFWRIYSRRTAFRDRPMKGMIQIIKGLLIGIWVIITDYRKSLLDLSARSPRFLDQYANFGLLAYLFSSYRISGSADEGNDTNYQRTFDRDMGDYCGIYFDRTFADGFDYRTGRICRSADVDI